MSAWRLPTAAGELLYALAGIPLGLVGLVYVVVPAAYGLLFMFTVVGLPLLALLLLGARRLGALHRAMARRLLGLNVEAPPRFQRKRGVLGWTTSALSDTTSWRAAAYLVLNAPAAVLSGAVAAALYAYGLLGTLYPALRLTMPVEDGRRGLSMADTAPRALAMSAVGLGLLFLAPQVVRAVLMLNKLLVRGLLGPGKMAQRVRDLERTRAQALDDSAAQLRRIERDLHDGAQARIATVALQLGAVKEELAADNRSGDLDEARALVDAAHRNAKDALQELRDLVRGVHPPVLDAGLEAALTTVAARTALPVELSVDLSARPSPAIETIAYFCATELLANVVKHSAARHARIDLTGRPGRLLLQVGDDGAGGAHLNGGHGLAGLAERIRTVDGRLEIVSPPGGPTLVTVDLPAPCAS